MVSDRKAEILENALEIVGREGYGNLSMRALARASGLKLGALQHHFPTWDVLLQALAQHVSAEYSRSLEALERKNAYQTSILDIARWYLLDQGGEGLQSPSRLWPQLWAMARVEPVLGEALDDIFCKTVALFESRLIQAGSDTPRQEALALLAVGEGSLLIAGTGALFEDEARSLNELLLQQLEARYGATRSKRRAARA